MTEQEATRVGLVGLGTVGSRVANRLIERRESLFRRTGARIDLTHVAEMDLTPEMEKALPGVELYRDALTFIEEAECDIVVELIGGLEPAGTIITRAVEQGKDVVTANKELLAKKGAEIFKRAERTGARIRFEASVGGSIPVIRTIREAMVANEFEAVYGIINGTANYVLTRMAEDGQSFNEALQLAQEKGYAEADPSYDVEGDDSAHKIAVLAGLSFGTHVPLEKVHCEGITGISPEIMKDAHRLGYRIKLLGIAKRTPGGLDVRVHPTMIPRASAMAAVQNEYNAVFIQGDPVGSSMLYGKGAGGAPTSTAVISDVTSLAVRDDRVRSSFFYREEPMSVLDIKEVRSRYYLRLQALDRPGVLAQVTRILGDHGISIDSVIQHGRSEEKAVPVILTTHQAAEGDVQEAVQKISRLEVVDSDPVCLRIEEDLVGNS